jgi:hypothetical protein
MLKTPGEHSTCATSVLQHFGALRNAVSRLAFMRTVCIATSEHPRASACYI